MTGETLDACWWVARPGAPATAEPTDLSGATELLAYDPYRADPARAQGRPLDALEGLRSTLAVLAPGASVVVALPAAESSLIDQLTRQRGIRLAAIEPTDRDLAAERRRRSGRRIAAVLDALARELKRGWPKDHPRTE